MATTTDDVGGLGLTLTEGAAIFGSFTYCAPTARMSAFIGLRCHKVSFPLGSYFVDTVIVSASWFRLRRNYERNFLDHKQPSQEGEPYLY
jgi:hypothetical protein